MPTVRVSLVTPLDTAEVVRRLTDFGPGRADAWTNVDAGSVTVHEQGLGWADVTEGNKIGWERERYTWDVDAGTVLLRDWDPAKRALDATGWLSA